MKIPWKRLAKTAWDWARIIWDAKHPQPTLPAAPQPATADEAFERWKNGEDLPGA